MNKKQLAGLFLCNFAPFVVGSGALPLLPVYAAALGAPPVVAGYYLAVAYLGLAVGTFLAGWVSDRVHRRRALLVTGALLGIPTLWWVGRMDRVWALVALTGFVWSVGSGGRAGRPDWRSADRTDRRSLGLPDHVRGARALFGALAGGCTAARPWRGRAGPFR